jgi:hypothetical protein
MYLKFKRRPLAIRRKAKRRRATRSQPEIRSLQVIRNQLEKRSPRRRSQLTRRNDMNIDTQYQASQAFL